MMSHQNTVRAAGPAGPSPAATTHSSKATPPPNWLAHGLLAVAGTMLFALACASAWLSYHAQVGYVLAHNGNLRTEAKIWALLLDAGTAGVSLLRLYETLQRGANAATRISLFGCITASVVMNLLHTPSRSPGGYLVAAVPPVMYAVFLEHLLANVRSVLAPAETRCSAWRTSTLWISFPAQMWSKWRRSLRYEAEQSPAAPVTDNASQRAALKMTGLPEQAKGDAVATTHVKTPAAQVRRPGRGLGPKRIAFEAALKDQLRSGDLRLFSDDERERNAAAYQAAASLPAPLSRGTARRYVVQALARLDERDPLHKLPTRRNTLK